VPAESVLGVDWCRGGWVAVPLRGSGAASVLAGQDLEALIARVEDVAVVAVDMPIGLPERERDADREARRYVVGERVLDPAGSGALGS
jgi:predicted RNase H-like nuclease